MAGARSSQVKDTLILLVAWLLGVISSYFLIGFFASVALSIFHAILLPLIFTLLITIPAYCALHPLVSSLDFSKLRDEWPTVLAVLIVGRFTFRVVEVALSVPNVLRAEQFALPAELLALFLASVVAALAVAWLIVQRLMPARPSWAARLVDFVRINGRGLLLAGLFFVIYFMLASSFNRQDFNTNNVFFAGDTHQWQLRLASASGDQMEMRAIHPLAFPLLRPAVSALAFVFGTPPFQAMLFLLALVGSASIFLAWLFLHRVTRNGNHAFPFAALLAISTSSLVFNVLAETYIFSAFFLILFFVLLQQGAHLRWLVISGIGVFGITISNLVQGLLGLFLADFKFKRALVFALWVVGLSALLSVAARQFFPDSGLFFLPQDYGVESQHYQLGGTSEDWAARAAIVGKDMFLFSVVAPQPFLLDYNRDGGGGLFPKFNFMLGERSSEFIGLGGIAAGVWAAVLAVATIAFIASLSKEKLTTTNRLALAFLGCLAFNLVFHFFYGFEPFLYAADWTYALVFFTALGLSSFAENKIVQIGLVLLLALLSLNNLSFIHYLMAGLSPYLPAP